MTLTIEQKEANKLARKQASAEAKIQRRILAEKNQNPVKKITLSIEWAKSSMWGSNPKLEAKVWFKDGTFEHSQTFTCSGCGYDKESTVIADVFNAYLKYKLYNELPNELPYGIYAKDEKYKRFDGGIGTSCYYGISKAIGGEFTNVANGKAFGVFEYVDNA